MRGGNPNRGHAPDHNADQNEKYLPTARQRAGQRALNPFNKGSASGSVPAVGRLARTESQKKVVVSQVKEHFALFLRQFTGRLRDKRLEGTISRLDDNPTWIMLLSMILGVLLAWGWA